MNYILGIISTRLSDPRIDALIKSIRGSFLRSCKLNLKKVTFSYIKYTLKAISILKYDCHR